MLENSARLIERAGFDGIWASGFAISASMKCIPDASFIDSSEQLAIERNIVEAVSIPVIADCDTGYGNAVNVAHTVREFEAGTMAPEKPNICKAFIGETCFDVCVKLVQLWGGSGIMNSTGVNRYMRDARAKCVAEGATEMHYVRRSTSSAATSTRLARWSGSTTINNRRSASWPTRNWPTRST
mgnify:CR=1 FL=1